jgi:hypothetical protein
MRRIYRSLIVILLIGVLGACGLPSESSNEDARIQTAIIDTAIAEATFQAAIYEAAQGTNTAIPLPPTITPEAPVDPYALSEEELAALIDANYEDVIYNSTDASEVLQEAASDEQITEEEIYDVVNFVYAAEASIRYAEELTDLYEGLYSELAGETLELLLSIEEDLALYAETMAEIEGLLIEGSAVATESIGKINSITTELQLKADEALNSKRVWRDTLQSNLNERELKYTSFTPNEIAPDRDRAILQTYAYLDSVKIAFQDRKITVDEMTLIAQLGANAKASLQTQVGPGLQILSNSIDGLTRQLSRGQWPQAQGAIGSFEGALPQKP